MKNHEQLEWLRKELGLKGEEMAAELCITPEWYSKLINQKAAVSADVMLRARDLASRNQIDLNSRTSTQREKFRVSESGVKRDQGTAPFAVADDESDPYPAVLDRFNRPDRKPSTLQDCADYVRIYLERAGLDGDPDNGPAIMARLKKNFPMTDWEKKDDE